ncbi:hypothetical protein BLOT_006642 [Blomia tropicalis]|nr:hypothetical protein BLOT_006642 [Blomia tropicalis]
MYDLFKFTIVNPLPGSSRCTSAISSNNTVQIVNPLPGSSRCTSAISSNNTVQVKLISRLRG